MLQISIFVSVLSCELEVRVVSENVVEVFFFFCFLGTLENIQI